MNSTAELLEIKGLGGFVSITRAREGCLIPGVCKPVRARGESRTFWRGLTRRARSRETRVNHSTCAREHEWGNEARGFSDHYARARDFMRKVLPAEFFAQYARGQTFSKIRFSQPVEAQRVESSKPSNFRNRPQGAMKQNGTDSMRVCGSQSDKGILQEVRARARGERAFCSGPRSVEL